MIGGFMARVYAELLPSNMYQPLATEFAYLAMTSGYIDPTDLLNIKGSMVKSICGTNMKLTNESLEEFDRLTEHFNERLNKDFSASLTHNCQVLANGLELPKNSWKVIQLMVVMATNGGLSEFIQHTLPADIYLSSMFGSMIGLGETDIININSALSETGIFSDCNLHLLDLVGLPKGIVDGLIGEQVDSYTALIAPLVQLQPSSELTTKDITHLNISALVEFLTVAVNYSLVGVNILLHGEAGTGKTELSKLIADTVGAALIGIRPLGNDINQSKPDFDNNISSSGLRLQYHRLVQNVVSHDEKTLLVIDEAEDIFLQAASNRGLGKEVLHHILENNSVPTIWITNHIDALPSSCIRRFNFTKNIHIPDNRVMENLINKTTKGLRLSKAFKTMLAAKQHVTPANITNANFVCRTLELVGKQAEATILDMIDETLSACGFEEHTAMYKAQMPFSSEYLNIQGGNQAIEQIAEAVNKNGDIRVLLFGVPGTGKTALVNHLAESLEQELITVKCSDILDKYVGQSERNVARIFRQVHQQNAILFLDEVDSLLCSRESLSNQFERQLVNEFLQQIEQSELTIFAATNHAQMIDKAALRRFDFKLTLDYLNQQQVLKLYQEVVGKISKIEQQQLMQMRQLTAGDFAIIARRNRLSRKPLTNVQIIQLLQEENNRKQQRQSIGFVQ